MAAAPETRWLSKTANAGTRVTAPSPPRAVNSLHRETESLALRDSELARPTGIVRTGTRSAGWPSCCVDQIRNKVCRATAVVRVMMGRV